MTAVIVDKISKAYRRYQHPIDSLKEIVLRRDYHEKFWALRDVSFFCNLGEVFGVIGDNGAGKSTLLKILAGTLKQTSGSLQIDGRVSAILELGSGFHPEYTGLENISLGCAMLGLDKQEIARRIPEIIEFSELGDFVKQPVKTYSSGMFVRLAFSVVTSVDPDILIVDEALSVGDLHFQKKSMDRMMAFKNQGKILLFCSHNLGHVKELCKQAVWLDQGAVKMVGPADEVVDAYKDHVRGQNGALISVNADATGSAQQGVIDKTRLEAYLITATLLGGVNNAEGQTVYNTHGHFAVQVLARISESLNLNDVHIGIIIKRNDGVQCYGISTVFDGVQLFHKQDKDYGVIYALDKLALLSGEYTLEVWLIDSTSAHVYDSLYSCCPFKVRQETGEVGVAFLEHEWRAPQ